MIPLGIGGMPSASPPLPPPPIDFVPLPPDLCASFLTWPSLPSRIAKGAAGPVKALAFLLAFARALFLAAADFSPVACVLGLVALLG